MTDTPSIPPALTADEWADEIKHIESLLPVDRNDPENHRRAALYLYGQPFGFTQEDVEALGKVEEWLETIWDRDVMRRYAGVLAKIAALLPPR